MIPSLAIVIPVGPNDESWRALLPQLKLVNAQAIVLVTTQLPADEAALLSADPRVSVLQSQVGRGRQLNAGATVTDTNWLWFLHADSTLGHDTVTALHAHLAQGGSSLGYFHLRFVGDGPRWMALNEFGAYVRSRWLGLPFGDQGFVMRRSVYEQLGGFDEGVSGGEDHAFVWKARKAGIALQALPANLYTSARKYRDRGWLRTTCEHLKMTFHQVRVFSKRRSP